MFRIGLKFPCNGLNRVKKHGYSKLYLTARYYETRARVKCEPEGRLFKEAKLTSRFSGLKFSTDSPKSEKTRGTGTLMTISAVTLGALGLLAFAKKNPDFRATLEEWVPGTDHAIRIIFQEEATYLEFLSSFFESLKETIMDFIFPKTQEKGVAEKPLPPPKNIPDELLPANLVELEGYCGQAASRAITAYNKASCAIQDYNKDIITILEHAASDIGSGVWARLKDASIKVKDSLKSAEENAKDAMDSLERMYNLIEDPKFEASGVVKTVAKRNVKKIVDDVELAKKKFEDDMRSANVTEKFWKQVESARETFNEELQILFPGINVHDKEMAIREEALDLFVLYAYNKINSLQKEVARLQTIEDAKLKAALKATGEEGDQEKIEALICTEVNKEKRILQEEFDRKFLEEQKAFDDEMRRQLRIQAQVHADHLKEILEQKDREHQRLVNRTVSEQVELETGRSKLQLASIVGRLRGLDAALKARLDEERSACDAQMLWAACQALARAVKVAPPGATPDKAIRPLEPEINAVSKAAPKGDELVRATIEGIPEEAYKRGVFPEDALRERFLQVENMARRLALVPETGASLPIYVLSYLQSFLLVKAVGPIPKSELDDEPIDVEALNTYDILHRARYWMDRGDFRMTLRYLNLLEGAPRCIARDWMNEARILLETQQAVDTLLAYAGATGLVFLGGGDSPKAN
ncbi:MICOS complex subunit Mic60 isoform X1 [Orussus abietinus]|uniref:MICOS complex subunit Mic60 isoform X1 n=1 Tax=Orussus abietinus TaxID=222816 RepID=UPI000626C32B|nr:MICOS complex subunit Mic60 isoform X1 [Orussus abietinus]